MEWEYQAKRAKLDTYDESSLYDPDENFQELYGTFSPDDSNLENRNYYGPGPNGHPPIHVNIAFIDIVYNDNIHVRDMHTSPGS